MTRLREFSKFFILLIAASFIGLMVFQWGMDYSGRSKQSNVVGEVNGKKLLYPQFTEMYQQLFQEQKARSGKTEFSDVELQQMRNQVWERFVQQTLFAEEMEKLGISVSDSEIVYQIYNYPLEDFKQHPSFQTNGIFDINKYHASFNNPQIPWRQVEDIYRNQIPFIKLQNIITSTARISEEEIHDAFEKSNLKAKAEYLSILPRQFESDAITVSEEEVKSYYNDHKEDYKQPEQRALDYVLFEIKTTAEDTAHLMSEFDQVRQRLAEGDSFADLAREFSEDPSVKQNDGVIDYFERGAMVKPFSDAAFSAKVGQLVGPIQTSYGFHLIRVEDKKKEKGVEKVKVSHILMKVTPAPSRVSEIESRARYFSEDAQANGFIKQAETNGYEVKSTNLFAENSSFIPGIGNNLAIMNFAFANKLNKVSGIYNLEKRGYVVVQVSEIVPEGYKDLESVKRGIETRVKFAKAKDLARTFATSLEEKVKSDTPFKDIAASVTDGKLAYAVTPEFTMEGTIPGIGRSIEFAASAFALEPGQRSSLVEAERAFYYIDLLSKTAFDSSAYNSQKDAIQRQLLTTKRNRIFEKWYAALKDDADITDNRKMFGL